MWQLIKVTMAALDTPFWEGLKTALRPTVFALLTALVEYLLAWLKVAHLGVSVVFVATFLLTALDSYLHQQAKLKEQNGLPMGIVPF